VGNQKPAAPSALSRLTASQYRNTLRDLFSPIAVPDQSPPADIAVEGFDNNASAQTPSSTLVDFYRTAAVTVTTAAMVNANQLLGCTPTTTKDENTCVSAFLTKFGSKAFRHPVTSTELTNLTAYYTAQRTAGADFPTAMTLTIEAILQSPSFLYRVEIGAPIAGKFVYQLVPFPAQIGNLYSPFARRPAQRFRQAVAHK